jgi:voltage-gated potassium channel
MAGVKGRHPLVYTPLCAALLLVQVTSPLLEQSELASTALTTLFLLAGLLALRSSPRVRLMAAAALVVIVVSRWASIRYAAQTNELKIASALLIATYAVLLAGHVVAAVYRERELSFDTIVGAISVYFLIAHTFALVYFALELAHQGSIAGADLEMATGGAVEGWPLSAFLYFSFVTLTTLGYGDMSPASPAARSLVMLEATCGQFFLAVLVARLVSAMAPRKR